MNGCDTPAQHAAGVHDAVSAFFADTLASGAGFSDPTLVRAVTTLSARAVEFVREHGGVDLNAVVQCGGHSAPRTHHVRHAPGDKARGVGWEIISGLRRAVDALPPGAVTTLVGHRAIELVQDIGGLTPDVARGALPVTGVRVASRDGGVSVVAADAVVLATGGYANDHTHTSLLIEFAPEVACLPTTNGPFAQGDGVKLARAAGAHLRGMSQVQVHPTGFVDPRDQHARTRFLAPEALRGHGGLLLDHTGARFVDELGRRDAVTAAMYAHCLAPGHSETQASVAAAAAARGLPPPPLKPLPVRAFMLLTPRAAAAVGPSFGFYAAGKGFFVEAAGAAGVAALLGAAATEERVRGTIAQYRAAAASGVDARTGKTVFPDAFGDGTEEDGPLWLATVTPSVHYTMGGVAVNAAAELLYCDMSEVRGVGRVGGCGGRGRGGIA